MSEGCSQFFLSQYYRICVLILNFDCSHHARLSMLLDVAMGKPNSGMLWYESNSDTFPGANQNCIPRKLLDFLPAITFQNSEEYPVDVHWMKPRAAVLKYYFSGYP